MNDLVFITDDCKVHNGTYENDMYITDDGFIYHKENVIDVMYK